DIKFGFNIQHDCSSGSCKPSGRRPVLQERKETNLEESFIEHDVHVSQFLISTSSLHNPHLLRRILRPALIQPLPLWADRVLLHQKQAERLCTGRDAKKIKNAAVQRRRELSKPPREVAPRLHL
ncbi:hypothetical protein B0H13DRAFT_1666630, partial [Mycena leptocephala]